MDVGVTVSDARCYATHACVYMQLMLNAINFFQGVHCGNLGLKERERRWQTSPIFIFLTNSALAYPPESRKTRSVFLSPVIRRQHVRYR